jgi:hypothetical protein
MRGADVQQTMQVLPKMVTRDDNRLVLIICKQFRSEAQVEERVGQVFCRLHPQRPPPRYDRATHGGLESFTCKHEDRLRESLTLQKTLFSRLAGNLHAQRKKTKYLRFLP